MEKKKLYRIILATLLAFCTLTLLSTYYLCWQPNFLANKQSQQLEIPHGISFNELQAKLHQEGYVTYITSFSLLARLMRYDRRVIPGAYQLRPNMTNWQVIRLLRAGAQHPVKIVLHHAQNKKELAHHLTRNLELNSTELLKLLNDPDFLMQYGFQLDNVLTMFIPNTYEVYWTVSAQALFERMHREYQKFWNEHRRSHAQRLQLTPTEVAILASIVQSETNKIEEAPLIAGVYINRLRKKIALNSCPTLLYILDDPSVKRVLKKHKALDSPYNTYKYRGLPPGPICLPSIAMIDAVLRFTSHNYFYFSAKEDFSGYHYFTNSFKEHLRNARRYQRALNQAKIYR